MELIAYHKGANGSSDSTQINRPTRHDPQPEAQATARVAFLAAKIEIDGLFNVAVKANHKLQRFKQAALRLASTIACFLLVAGLPGTSLAPGSPASSSLMPSVRVSKSELPVCNDASVTSPSSRPAKARASWLA